MTYPITIQTEELLGNAGFFEERRSQRIYIESLRRFAQRENEPIGTDTSRGEADTNGHCEDLPPDENKSVK